MTDPTNAIPAAVTFVQTAPAQIQSTFNAWHVVALGLGAYLMNVYHIAVNAGGVKTIWRNFWSGPAKPPATPPLAGN